jgi:RNA polymerase sigma-70 factor, ECF subfamily
VTTSVADTTDASLIERAAHGDRVAFDLLASGRATGLYNVARMVLRDDDVAADALQETLVRAWRDLPRLRDRDRFGPWLHRLLVNACYDETRRKRRWRLDVTWTDSDVGSRDDQTSAIADHDQLARGLARLPVDQRVVVVLRYYLDLPHADIAEILGIPAGTVRSRTNRALAGLRAVLESELRTPVTQRRSVV